MKSWTMPRNPAKSVQRSLSEVCSDCGAPDANWTSVNRSVLMCNDCASVHMGLGRHISQVKHLQKSHWHPNLSNMVQHLITAGANSIWEHLLLDPAQMRSGKRKPNPSDIIHPTKSDFIKSKYLNLQYVHRMPIREDEHHDISKQLHSSVRTGNLETSLRLLSLGAHADFFNNEKGNTPLHVAAKCGQSMQVELLIVYGANPGTRDSNGKTAEDLARAENHNDLADRLVELHYEVSDKFTSYVCGETPDHKAGQHYILPKIKDAVLISPEGKKRLRSLSNQTFEVLAMDVYDELERRNLEKIWQDVQKSVLIPGKGLNPALQTEVVPFLPLHPDYSTTRNQGRQKLAHFKESELSNLISDILHEIIRREKIFGPIVPSVPEEDPIYDVPPDEDQELNVDSIEKSSTVEPPKEMVAKEEILALKKVLEEKEAEILKLKEQNRELSNKATDLARENIDLNKRITKLSNSEGKGTPISQPLQPSCFVPRSSLQSHARPGSAYNPNDSSGSQSSLPSTGSNSDIRRRTFHNIELPGGAMEEPQQVKTSSTTKPDTKTADNPSHCSTGSYYDNSSVSKDEIGTAKDKKSEPISEKAEAQQNNSNANNNLLQSLAVSLVETEPDLSDEEPVDKEPEPEQEAQSDSSSPNTQVEAVDEEMIWPERQALMKKTELLTKMIQTLLQRAQLTKIESYLDCAENILSAVTDVIALFDKPHMPAIKSDLQQICGSAHKLRNRCKESPDQKLKADGHKQLTEEIIAYAYAIAKAEKKLVMMAPKEESEASTSSA